jgi:hypothetical protein
VNERGADGGSRMDKWMKRIWFVNGILILIFFGWMLVEDIGSHLPGHKYKPPAGGPMVGDKLEKAKADTLALQDITSSWPSRIGKTKYCYISLWTKDLTTPVRLPKPSDRSSGGVNYCIAIQKDELNVVPNNEAVNLIFMSDDGSDVRLLLNEKGAIVRSDIPTSEDTSQSFNLYRIVFRDTNGDGRLTSDDQSTPYISDLDGRNLRPLTPDSVVAGGVVRSFRKDEVFISGQIRSKDPKVPEADWVEINFKYNVRTGKLSSILPDDRLLNEARRILQTK